MDKVLVVGCGGSGAKTLAFMMDQIKADLALYGWDRIPAVWQFVNIDTPVDEEQPGFGIPRVSDQGGTYVSCGVRGGSYPDLDGAIVDDLSREPHALRQLATVLPNHPSDLDGYSIEDGAGQMRGLGRLLTVRRLKDIHAALKAAVERLESPQALQDAHAICEAVPGLGKPPVSSSPLVFVVSSMAGGTGASMTLDVARILSNIPGIKSEKTSLVLYTADVFKKIKAHTSGLPGNTLAFFGEAMAAQLQGPNQNSTKRDGAAVRVDSELYRIMGLPIQKQRTFKTILPIGSKSYDGEATTPEAVYRSTGRALARYLDTNALVGYSQYVLANQFTADFLWGVNAGDYGWNSLGYASLSMGRDRYLEYAAQRLARRGMDRAFEGHLEDAAVGVTSKQRVEQLWQIRGAAELNDLGLRAAIPQDPAGQNPAGWAIAQLGTDGFYAEIRRQLENQVIRFFPTLVEGIEYGSWFNGIQATLSSQRDAVIKSIDEWVAEQAKVWATNLSLRLQMVIARAIADYSVPYALEIVRKLRDEALTDLITKLLAMDAAASEDPTIIPAEFASMGNGRGGLNAQGMSIQQHKMMEFVASKLYGYSGSKLAALCGRILKDYVDRVVVPMETALEEAGKNMADDRKTEVVSSGVARVQSETYKSWPFEPGPLDSGYESVPARFGVADNEITLMHVSEYLPRFEADIKQMMAHQNENYSFRDAYAAAVKEVISGAWQVAGEEKAPRDLVTEIASWIPAPLTGGLIEARPAVFVVKLKAEDILRRARMYVLRRGESFERFAAQSLRGYLNGVDVHGQESVVREREALVVKAMTEAMTMAQPYSAQINQTLFNKVQSGQNPGLLLTFSDIPLTERVRQAVQERLAVDTMLNRDLVLKSFEDSCVASDVTKIDIFSSAPTTVPICYSDIFKDIAEAWDAKKSGPKSRSDFWFMRRTRPLPAVLPVGQSEYEALVRGWYVALAAGALLIPDVAEAERTPVQIWDFTAYQPGWISFPHPMLTSPDRFFASEWLPAVLESMLLAYVDASRTGDDSSFHPFRVLRQYADNASKPYESALEPRHDEVVLSALVRDGKFAGVMPPYFGAAESTPEARQKKLASFFEWLKTEIDTTFMPGFGKPEGRNAWTNYSTRALVETSPLNIDIADECVIQLEELKRVTLGLKLEDDKQEFGGPY